ncbi:hypothetical protein M1M25_gp075 [Tenacibaculum phage Gundel_1]|uniref:Uncharacterized protein n=1 Tax=Tenacibaculum phage Gundel_1 TaxID=2745672 RepID=A0A8E5EBM0_9CAUD|nr:hypothetical protein M1M25_gp075 [Tenacibaculum phage Gundel_1]QQV91511.1 hypothetical protein Gundel1_75 [Tenacibaculum phage Gundel_1]
MVKEYKQQLKDHITALEKGYDNLILILKEDVEKDDEGKIALKDDKIKSYADGILKAAQASDDFLLRIKTKKTELEELENEGEPIPKEKDKPKNSQNPINKRLQ